VSAPSKWTIRKYDGLWYVWRPGERDPISSFGTGAAALSWRPDCDRFLKGYCYCRFECGQ
jgi:hypothetical protein